MASKSKARLAFACLSSIAVFLIVALVTCVPREEKRTTHEVSPETGSRTRAPVPLDTSPERLAPQQKISPASGPETPWKGGRMAIIIDDAGYNLEDLQPFLDYSGPLAIAVLPNLPFSVESARRVVSAGKTLLLHCPMEPLNGENPGPGVIRTDQTDLEIESLLESALATVPGAVGINNHMGSKATADDRLMSVVFSFCKKRGMFFVDSRTTVESVAARVAELDAVPFLARDVFIDNERNEEDIARSISAGIAKAGSRGSAVLIGHIHTPQILDILMKEARTLGESKIRIVGLAEIFKSEKGSGG